ncbi:eIF2A-related protein [Flexithrix dorotheae]|uniref:eIF2A-related protein n=1 Tax=Flexithrix dorotheae TaxID=70993 RepID=UPI000360327D|nr:TIR domain-containing protein [Flexithrix dorotheae]
MKSILSQKCDLYVSYSHYESIDLAEMLEDKLSQEGYEVKLSKEESNFDEEVLSDCLNQIEYADNFVFIISPHSLNSILCDKEISQAIRHSKRIIPILHIEPEQDELFKQVPPVIKNSNWIFLRKENNPESKSFKLLDELDTGVNLLINTLQKDKIYVEKHTELLSLALHWEAGGKDSADLLMGKDLKEAEEWLAMNFVGSSPPCIPSELHIEFISESKKFSQLLSSHSTVLDQLQQNHLLKIIILILTGLVITIAGFWIFQIIQNSNLEGLLLREKSNHLAARSKMLQDIDPTQSLNEATASFFSDTLNPKAISAVIEASYNTGSFYEVLSRTANNFTTLNFSAKYREIVTGDEMGVVSIRDMHGETKISFEAHHGAITASSVSPNGQFVLTSGVDQKISLWKRNGELVTVFPKEESNINFVAFSNNGLNVAAVNEEGDLKVFDLVGNLIFKYQSGKPLKHVNFSKNEKLIVTGNHVGEILIFSSLGKPLATWNAHKAGVSTVFFNEENDQIISASLDGTVKIWNLEGKLLLNVQAHQAPVNCARFVPGGQYFITASNDNSAIMWDYSGRAINHYLGHKDPVKWFDFTNFGEKLLTISGLENANDKSLRIWDTEKETTNEFDIRNQSFLDGNFSPDGKLLVTVCLDSTARIWNRAGKEVLTLKGHQAGLSKAVFSFDGKNIATADLNGIIKIWDLNGVELNSLKGHQGQINDLAWGKSGQKLISAGKDNNAILFDVSGGQIAEFKGHSGSVNSVKFSPEERRIITSSNDGTAIIWDVEGNLLKKLSGHKGKVFSANFSRSGNYIITAGSDFACIIWDMEGNIVRILKNNESREFKSANFAPDGRHIFTGDGYGKINIWNEEGVAYVAIDPLNEYPAIHVSFSNNFQRVFIGLDGAKPVSGKNYTVYHLNSTNVLSKPSFQKN